VSIFVAEMKKAFASILLVVYAMVSTGFVVSVHYCMDQVNAVQLGDAARDKCNKCGMPVKAAGGCCKDEVKVYKLQVDQAFAKFAKADFSLPAILSSHSGFLLAPLFSEVKINAPIAHGPPLSEQDTYLQNRVFRL
jgi:hypothetical protein